jgi:hypothetical protein
VWANCVAVNDQSIDDVKYFGKVVSGFGECITACKSDIPDYHNMVPGRLQVVDYQAMQQKYHLDNLQEMFKSLRPTDSAGLSKIPNAG